MSPRRVAPEKKKQAGLPSWILVAAAAVIVLVVVAIGADFIAKSQPSLPLPTTVSSAGIIRSGRTEGDPNAPLSLVEFSDFQ